MFEQHSPAAPCHSQARSSSPSKLPHSHRYRHNLQPSWDQISHEADEAGFSGFKYHTHRHAGRHRHKPSKVDKHKAASDDDTDLEQHQQQQQQQRMIELLKLRSDELSGENGRLRLQVAAANQQYAQPMQCSFDASHAELASHYQSASTAQAAHEPFLSSPACGGSLSRSDRCSCTCAMLKDSTYDGGCVICVQCSVSDANSSWH